MNALIWKELRENVKWAVLAMIGLTLAEIYGLYYTDPSNYNNQGVTLCNPPFLMATSLGNAVAGLLLGFLQILPEQRRDQWAALLHRPVTRGVIFRGKAVAGVLLYLLATVPPFLLCLYLSATPGHFVAPFVPELMLPSLSDIFIGLAYYFAALAAALQRGSWFGARSFALLSAIYLSCSAGALHFFYVAVEAAVLLSLILFAAAWGAMLSNGKFADRPRLTQAALLLAAFLGVCGLGLLGTIMMNSGQQYGPWTGSEYKITEDGKPFVYHTNQDLTTTLTGLDGKPLPNPDLYLGRNEYQNVIEAYDVADVSGHKYNEDRGSAYYNYRLSRLYVEQVQQYGNLNPIQWFHLSNYNFSVGIDRRSRQPEEIADRTGFHPISQPIEPFTGTFSEWYSSPALVQEGSDAYLYYTDKEQAIRLPGTDTSPVYGIGARSYVPANGKGDDQIIVVARGTGLQMYDSNGAALAALAFNPKVDLDRFGSLGFGNNRAATRFYVQYQPSGWIPWPERRHMPMFLDEVDINGAILNSYTLPALPEPPSSPNWQAYIASGLQSPAFWFCGLANKKIGGMLGNERLANQAKDTFGAGWDRTRDTSERILIFSLVTALIALLWARRAGISWSRTAAWTAFVFFVFRAVADWPVRVQCPSCQRLRNVEEPACGHCKSGWPRPERHGLEIFEDAGAPAAEATRN
jgi:hypothetical protein